MPKLKIIISAALLLAISLVIALFISTTQTNTGNEFTLKDPGMTFVSLGEPDQHLNEMGGKVDGKGVLLTSYSLNSGTSTHYNPAFIANYALVACNHYLKTGNLKSLDVYQRQLAWMREAATPRHYQDQSFHVWPYTFSARYMGLNPPWYSAFANTLIAAALICGPDVSDADKRLAESAVNALTVPVDVGGLMSKQDGHIWFEEYAKSDYPVSRVLNGHIVATHALWWYAWKTGSPKFQRLALEGVNTVAAEIYRYDTGYLSYYAQFPPAGFQNSIAPYPEAGWYLAGRKGYHITHVQQLMWCYEMTGNPDFLKYALRFIRYEDPRVTIRAKGSTDPVTNGPAAANFELGNSYWSHSKFPTWLEVDMGRVFPVYGINFIAASPASAPRDFDVEISSDGIRYSKVKSVSKNDQRRVAVVLPRRNARFVRLVINSDNGNNNTAILGLYVRRSADDPLVVSDVRNFHTRPLPSEIFNKGCWSASHSTGWILLDLQDQKYTPIHFELPENGKWTYRTVQGLESLRDAAERPLPASGVIDPAGGLISLNWSDMKAAPKICASFVKK